jgi:hypothetical protein
MRGGGAGDVDFVNHLMVAQKGADIRAAGYYAQGAKGDERPQGAFEKGDEIVVHRIHLQDDDLVLDEQFLKAIERRDRGDVSSPQHDGDSAAAVGGRRRIARSGIAGQVLLGDARLHPDIGGHPGHQQPVPDRVRHHPGGNLPVREFANWEALEELPAVHLRQSLQEEVAGAHQRIGAAEPFLAFKRRSRRYSFFARRRLRPGLGDRRQMVLDLREHRHALADRRARPGVFLKGEIGERRFQLGRLFVRIRDEIGHTVRQCDVYQEAARFQAGFRGPRELSLHSASACATFDPTDRDRHILLAHAAERSK